MRLKILILLVCLVMISGTFALTTAQSATVSKGKSSNIVYIATTGNDDIGTGTIDKPY